METRPAVFDRDAVDRDIEGVADQDSETSDRPQANLFDNQVGDVHGEDAVEGCNPRKRSDVPREPDADLGGAGASFDRDAVNMHVAASNDQRGAAVKVGGHAERSSFARKFSIDKHLGVQVDDTRWKA